MQRARAWHLLTFLVTLFALVFQFVLTWRGEHVLDENADADLGTRIVRFFSYLTIWFNLIVAGTSLALVVNPDRDGRMWRALRMNAVVLSVVVGLVSWFILRPMVDLDGAAVVGDRLLHVVVPILTVVGWLFFGPRDRIPLIGQYLALPVVWLVYTFIRGAVVDWYPYPFLDVSDIGYARTALNCLAVAVLMIGLYFLCRLFDPKLPGNEKTRS